MLFREFCKIFKNIFSYRKPPVAASVCNHGSFVKHLKIKNHELDTFAHVLKDTQREKAP